MTDISDKATELLKEYTTENGTLMRSTSDLSPLEEWMLNKLVKYSLGSVIESFNREKMETIVPHYIVDMGKIPCNELRFIVETFLAQNEKYRLEVERLNSL